MVKNITPEINVRVSAGFMNSNVQQGMLGIDIDYESTNSLT